MKYFCNELFVSSDISDEELFPVLLMDWVEGVPLDLYLHNCIDRGRPMLLSSSLTALGVLLLG